MLYTSIENNKIKEIKKLNQKKYRDKQQLFLVESRHLVLEAYKTGYLKTLILEQDEIFPLNIETMYVTNDIIHYLGETETPQTIMGVCEKVKEAETPGSKILILDNIQDPGNMGTIIRSAVAFGVDTIILGDGCVDLYNPKVVRSSQGMIFHMNFMRKNLLEWLPTIKGKYQIIGTKVTHGKDIKTLEKNQKIGIIMGNEGNGIQEDILELCDEYVYIPMSDVCESLNVGVATSILLYELSK
mgnify:FL=1